MSKNPWYRIAIVAVLAVAVVVVLSGRKPAVEPPDANAESSTAQRAASGATPSGPRATDPALPRLVDLGADKCIPCKMMAPILEELKKEQAGKINVEFIDVWKNPDAGNQYGISVIPTQIFYDAEGKELYRHEGFFPKDEILAVFKKHGIEPAKGKTDNQQGGSKAKS